MYCIHCGGKLPDEANFCSHCGQQVSPTAAPKRQPTTGTKGLQWDRKLRTVCIAALAIILVLSVSVIFLARKPAAESADKQTAPVEVAPPTTIATEAAPIEVTLPADYILQTPYFTLTTPGDWENLCIFESTEQENGRYVLNVYEGQGYEDWRIGNLFTILLLPPNEDYRIYPDYRVLGTLESPDWEQNVVVLFPTDVQYSDDTKETYLQLQAQVDAVLGSLDRTDATTFHPGEVVQVRNQINTPYYTLDLPDSWVNACTYDIIEQDNGTYNLIVYEARSYQEFGGGKLFSILMLPVDQDYTDYPSYEYLGKLESLSGECNLVVLFPTDVQFSEDTAEQYSKMYDRVYSVFSSLAAQEDCIYHPDRHI